MWTYLKDNSDNSSYEFDYADVNYYNYEYTSATGLYIIGTQISEGSRTWYVAVPPQKDVFQAVCNWGIYTRGAPGTYQEISVDYIKIFSMTGASYSTNGYINLDKTAVFSENIGSQHTFFQSISFSYDAKNKLGVVVLI